MIAEQVMCGVCVGRYDGMVEVVTDDHHVR